MVSFLCFRASGVAKASSRGFKNRRQPSTTPTTSLPRRPTTGRSCSWASSTARCWTSTWRWLWPPEVRGWSTKASASTTTCWRLRLTRSTPCWAWRSSARSCSGWLTPSSRERTKKWQQNLNSGKFHSFFFSLPIPKQGSYFCTTDGAARIYHLMPRRDSNPRQLSCTWLGHLKNALATEPQRCSHVSFFFRVSRILSEFCPFFKLVRECLSKGSKSLSSWSNAAKTTATFTHGYSN